MAAKILLEVGPLDQEIAVFAISAPMKDYRFIWYLNKNIDFQFNKDEPYTISDARKSMVYDFSVFTCKDHSDIFFIGNRNENTLLLKQYRGVDFFMIWNRELDEEESEVWQKTLKSIPGITLVKQIEDESLADFQSMVAELEYQRMERKP